jgi:hypothetical protein
MGVSTSRVDAAFEQFLQLLPAPPVRPGALVDTVASEQVEDHVRRGPRERQLLRTRLGGMDPLLQRSEVQPALVPDTSSPSSTTSRSSSETALTISGK